MLGSLLPFLLLALTGCVAGAEGPSPTDPHGFTTTTTVPTSVVTSPVEQGLADFGECMSERGVAVGEIPIDGLGRPRMSVMLSELGLGDSAVLEALEACGIHLTSGALALDSDPELRALVQEELRRFSECVRLEGVGDYPDPVPGFDGVGSPYPLSRIPWDHPGLGAATEACRNSTPGT